MPLIYGPTEMTNPQPKNFVTPSRTTGIYVQNVSPLALIITSGLGSIELPPWQTATLEMMPNDNMNVSAIPITAVPPALAAYAYVDISYTFQGVTVQGSGLFFPFMTPGGDAVAAGIMGPDGLQVGTSTSNPNGSSLLVQATGSNVPDSDGNRAYYGDSTAHVTLERAIGAGAQISAWTPAAGKMIRLLGGVISASAATVLHIVDATSGTVKWPAYVAANTPVPIILPPGGVKMDAVNDPVNIYSTAAVNVTCVLYGAQE